VVRKRENKDYTDREKQMMISLFNYYSLFGLTDDEMIQMLSIKLGNENIKNSFLSLKERSH